MIGILLWIAGALLVLCGALVIAGVMVTVRFLLAAGADPTLHSTLIVHVPWIGSTFHDGAAYLCMGVECVIGLALVLVGFGLVRRR